MTNTNPVRLPMGVGCKLRKAGEPLPTDAIKTYQELIGSLLYLSTGTRPDLSFAVGRLSRYVAAPTADHMAAAKTVLRYLCGTPDLSLMYRGSGELIGYCDADYAGDLDTRRSTTRYVFTCFGPAVSWGSKQQASVAKSTTEAEYVAAATAAKGAVWLRRLVGDLTGKMPKLTPLCDNQGAVAMMHNAVSSPRTKHIDIDHHFIREKIEEGLLVVVFIPSASNLADILTKALPVPAHSTIRKGMGEGDSL